MDKQIQLTKKERREIKRQKKIDERQRQSLKRKYSGVAIWLVVLLAVGGLIFGFLKIDPQSSSSGSTDDILKLKNDDYMQGSPTAKAVLIEYLDFECEACGAYYPVIKQIKEEFKDDLVVAVRYFPLPGHSNGLASALAVEAAARQGKYWEMHDYLFEKQGEWGERKKRDDGIFEQYARDIGLDLEQFKEDRDSKSVKDRVKRDQYDAKRLRLNGTPSFFLNGEKIQNPRSFDRFKKLISETI